MTDDEIKAARALCANVKESECEACVCRDCLAEYQALDEIRDILPVVLDEVERLKAALAEAVDIANDQVRQRTNLAAAVEGDAWRMAALRSALADALDALDAIAAGTFFRPEEYARQKAAALKSKVAP